MPVFSSFLGALIGLFLSLLTLYMWVVIIAAVITWVNPDPYNPIVRILRNLTEPVFAKIRKLIPFVVISGIDLSPLVVIVLIQFIQIFVRNLFMGMAMGI